MEEAKASKPRGLLSFLFGRRDIGREPVKVILGLGNPGREYEGTRHNVGWWVVDHLADVWLCEGWRKDGDALVSNGVRAGKRVKLVKPLTYMNLSGRVLRPYLRRESWSPSDDLLVVVDDVALPLGRSRLRAEGSSGGHNGLASVEEAVGSRNYPRLRIGIRPADERRIGDLSDFVLTPFARDERDVVLSLMPRFTAVADEWLQGGIQKAIDAHNRQPNPTTSK